ncbi:MAG: DUF3108 domain-containing protein [Roseivirga sp.]|nr:DUF3108 domain-containing protein [Roseivirga sp.]
MKKELNILATLALTLLVSCGARAQKPEPVYQKVLPADVNLIPNRISPHRVTYKKGKGTMIYDMHKVSKWGREVYELAIYFGDENVTPDLIYMDMSSLGFAGRKLRMDKAGYTLDLQFEQNTMKGALTPHEGSDYEHREYNRVHPHQAFEPAVINYAITALPLKEGYTASIPTMDLNNGSEIIWANIKVEKREKVKIGGRTFDTWKVISNGIRNKTLWVTTTEPYVIKMKTRGNPGTWELVVD